ncbi:hypothetical protein MMC10_000739 [Thelotrema lepadinum]|nr:hypothetical protein [Thelotrema lepadinum]
MALCGADSDGIYLSRSSWCDGSIIQASGDSDPDRRTLGESGTTPLLRNVPTSHASHKVTGIDATGRRGIQSNRLPSHGIWPWKQEIVDYQALFRYVEYLIGTPTSQMESPEKANAAMESLLLEARKPSASSRTLAHNIVKSMTDMPPTYASQQYWEAGAR